VIPVCSTQKTKAEGSQVPCILGNTDCVRNKIQKTKKKRKKLAPRLVLCTGAIRCSKKKGEKEETGFKIRTDDQLHMKNF
jgi:predicted sulfurtransferase